MTDIHGIPETLARIAHEAIADGVVPGLVVHAERLGARSLTAAFGARSTVPLQAPAHPHTLYDLASLTKALATTTLCMQAVQRGQLDPDARAADFLPALMRQHETVTVRALLSHSAGLPAHRKLYEEIGLDLRAQGQSRSFVRTAIIGACAEIAPEYPPGSRSVYSDLGFILLGAILETVNGMRLDTLFATRVAEPLGIPDLAFIDLETNTSAGATRPAAAREFAPTEDCPVRGRLISGEVHDLNAWAMGGVAGHAGLFGTIADVALLGRELLRLAVSKNPKGDSPLLLSSGTVRAFFAPAGVPGSTWGLGWDHPAAANSLAGTRLSKAAVGHLGFTGTSIWLDPESQSLIIALSNRVHPAVDDGTRFRALRPRLHDALMEALDGI